MENFYVGIDVAKLTFVAAVKVNHKYRSKSFGNGAKGFKLFIQWLEKFSTQQPHVCMESTGKYGDKLALFLHDNGCLVSVVNPANIKYFMKSQLARNKTDSVDAKYICQYCELSKPSLWKPLAKEVRNLKSLVTRLETLNNTVLQEQNRLENVDESIKDFIDNHIIYLKKQIKDIENQINEHISAHESLKTNAKLLKSITGIGEKTTHKILAFLSHVDTFDSARQLAAYVGLNPQQSQSGTSLNYSRISKTGNGKLRQMFYMPALVAIKHDPNIKAFYERLLSKGKAKKVAICAVMRKLVHIIYGVLTSQQPFKTQKIRSR